MPSPQTRERGPGHTPTAASPSIAVIAAVAANGVIGSDNRLPWRLSDDLKRFRELTTGHAVIMGRKTWESLAGALPNRQNIVVTRRRGYSPDGAQTAGSLDEALALVKLPEPVFCIGGRELFAETLPRADRLYLTEIDRDFAGDVHFPPWRDEHWLEIAREAKRAEGPPSFDYAYVTYERANRAL